VTSVERTLIDIAASGTAGQLRRALEEAAHRELFDAFALGAKIARAPGRRGMAELRARIGAYRPLPQTDSKLERRFLRLLDRAGIPMPGVNVPLLDYEVDCLWERERLVVELDSFEHHRDRATFESDRSRDVVLGLAGYRVLRFTHRRIVEQPAVVIEAMRSGLRDRKPRP